jgi:DNA modification methylase
MNIVALPLERLVSADYNPRIDLQPGSEDYDRLRRCIEEFGLVEPIIWNERSGTVISGHQRLKVLRELGRDDCECVVVDLDSDREKALNLAMNKIGGGWDDPKLAALLESFSADFDPTLSGFDLSEISALLDSVRLPEDDGFDVDAALEELGEPITRPGDLWQLGPHRLLCGDATKPADVARLMVGESASLLLTDPPYNVDYHGKAGKIENDSMSGAAFYDFLLAAFTAMFESAAPGAACYIFHVDSEGENFRRAFRESGFLPKQCLVWVKNVFVIGRQDYQWGHEPVLYGWKPGVAHYFVDDRSQSTVIDDDAPPNIRKMRKAQLLELAAALLEERQGSASTVLRCDKPLRSPDHPTMKPVELVGRLIKNSSRSGEAVLDPFGGSGTTLVAAEELKRRAFFMLWRKPVLLLGTPLL